jgi:uncharacterized protein involved in type VI secretion and phage assembly
LRAGGPKQDSLDHLQFGLQYGIVTQNKDPEKMNRIKVRLPWLDQGETDQSHWAQYVTPMEGKKYGWYALPDIDDVVVVMFIGGDISQPVILGGVWSTKDNSPEPNEDGKNNFRGYRSRSGHRLILDDTAKTKVVLADKTGKNMVGVGNFEKDGAGPNVCAVYIPPMAGTVGVSFSSMEGTLEITCKDGALKVEAGENIKINAETTIDIKAGGNISMKGSSGAKLTSTDNSNYDAQKVDIA